jgi:pimeloyl-ACP methyl ester carboxylesterase
MRAGLDERPAIFVWAQPAQARETSCLHFTNGPCEICEARRLLLWAKSDGRCPRPAIPGKGQAAYACAGNRGEKSFGTTMAKIMRFAATNVREGVIPDSGHWIMEENPTATISMVRAFLDANT